MSSPGPAEVVSVSPAALDAIAAELTTLAGELAEDAELCRWAARSFMAALHGSEGWTAQASATAWATLAGVLAGGGAALAGTLTAAVACYAAEEAALSARIRSGDRTCDAGAS